MHHIQRKGARTSQVTADSRDRDSDLSASPGPALLASGGAATTHIQALMAAGGNQGMVQLAAAPDASSSVDVVSTAAEGVRGGGGALPHGDVIQQAFGKHDVSGVGAHTGGGAAQACEAIGAEAYASGNDVAFASAPSLHTAAHEAAHVVQQRAGVSLKGGVGAVGDRYEQHADQVADAVVQGKSAEGILDAGPGGGSGGGGSGVQRLPVVQRLGAAATVDENGDVSTDYFVNIPTPRSVGGILPVPGPPIPGGPAVGLYYFAQAAARFGFQQSTAHAGKLYAQGRGDLGIAAGGHLSDGIAAEIFGGAAMILSVSGSSSLKKFDFVGSLNGALFWGVKFGPFKFQQRLGKIDLLTWQGTGLLERDSQGAPSADTKSGEFVQGRFVQREAAAGGDNGPGAIVGATLGDANFALGPELQAAVDGMAEGVQAILAVIEKMDEAAYDGIAAGGTLLGFEDPREVSARIEQEIEKLNTDHAEVSKIRSEWVAKGADYTSANNIALAWYNSFVPINPFLRKEWAGRYQDEMAQCEERIALAAENHPGNIQLLVSLGVEKGEANVVADLCDITYKFPGYYLDMYANGQVTEGSSGMAELDQHRRIADEAWGAAVERAENRAALENDLAAAGGEQGQDIGPIGPPPVALP